MRKFDGNELLIATHNRGKLEEIADLLSPFGVTVSSNADHGLPEPDETETTFVGNAHFRILSNLFRTSCCIPTNTTGGVLIFKLHTAY